MLSKVFKIPTRKISTFGVLRESLSEPLKVAHESQHEHHANPDLWKKLFLFVCIPALAISSINAYLDEPQPLPEFHKYPHLRIRNKKFFWRDGVKTLFHNPHTNALPDGYEHEAH